MSNTKCSLFYVDDDQDDLLLFKSAAEFLGKDVCIFDLGELMLYTLHNPPPRPSIVFVDLNMPIMHGFEIIKEIKNSPNLSYLPLIAYSTSSNPNDMNRCKTLGASMFVTKPNNFTDLKKIISTLTELDWANRKVDGKNFVFRQQEETIRFVPYLYLL